MLPGINNESEEEKRRLMIKKLRGVEKHSWFFPYQFLNRVICFYL